jgi:hypothetical protein
VTTDSLRGSLPNHVYVVNTSTGTVETRISQAVVVGRIVDARGRDARVYSGDEEFETVSFDDVRADERAVTVEIVADTTIGNIQEGDHVSFYMGMLGAEDPHIFLEGLRSLDRVIVVLTLDETGANAGTYRPVLGNALLGEILNDRVTFDGLGDDASSFIGDLDTVPEVVGAVEKGDVRHVLKLGGPAEESEKAVPLR